MACWNYKLQGDQLSECPVCGAKVNEKRKADHVSKCCDRFKHQMVDQMGLIKCPLLPTHIIPIVHLNHHLEGNCEGAQNGLRRYFQKKELASEISALPDQFLADVPDEVLNRHNKRLLYLLRKDLSGRDISGNKDLYPDPAPDPPGPGPASS